MSHEEVCTEIISYSLRELLDAANVLTGPSTSSEVRPADLGSVLRRRLSELYQLRGLPIPDFDASLQVVQLQTAKEALSLLEMLHNILLYRAKDHQPPEGGAYDVKDDPTLIGTRDLALIRTLISITFKWATEPLLQRMVAAVPSTSGSHVPRGASIIDLTGLPHDYTTLSSIISRLLALPISNGLGSPLAQSVITATLLNAHLPDLLLPSLVVGWLPRSLASAAIPPGDTIRPQVMYTLSRLPASQVLSAMGKTLTQASSLPPYVRKTCTFILGRQLIRPEGVRGLCESVFAEEDVSGEDASLEKLEHIARVLSSVPAAMKAEEYCHIVVPRMLLLLSADQRILPPAHRRAVAFSLSRMLTLDDNSCVRTCASRVVANMLHEPILKGSDELSPSVALRTLEVLLTNTDPSPQLISTLFTPIVPSLYALYSYLEGAKSSDPILREMVNGFLETWGRLVGSAEVIKTLWEIIDGEGGSWRVDVAGAIMRADDDEKGAESLALFTPESLQQAEESGDLDIDSNILGLKPDPVRLVQFVKSIGRADVSSELFVRLLEGYRDLQYQSGGDPFKTLLYLQLSLQMQKQLSSDDTSGVLKNPEHILAFIKHALENPRERKQTHGEAPRTETGLLMEDLRIIPEQPDDLEDGDSDDEEPDVNGTQTADDMMTTALKLLLSVLEANPDLSARNAPVLNEIFSLLEPLSRALNEDLRSLAREARMVMTARLASTSDAENNDSPKRSAGGIESPQETYQKALKLLQDPLLPVRGHGLLLLRQLVSARKAPGGLGLSEPALDRALVPGILSIFMQSIQDDDSYMYLNAVQGLSSMVDGYGKDVLRSLARTYTDGLDGLGASVMSQHDVDVRTRVGEALGQVVRRCGETLPSYAPLLVPPLFQVVRTSHFPTVIRTSAISLLAQCAKTNALAVLPYVADFAESMVDLLQLEMAPLLPLASTRSDGDREERENGDEPPSSTEAPKPQTTIDTQPTSMDTKLPHLRRAALHFLSLLVQASTRRVYETRSADGFLIPPATMRRARTTLGYIAATDADDIVRVMARETLDGLNQLAEAVVGL